MSEHGLWMINEVEEDMWDYPEYFKTKDEAIAHGKEQFAEYKEFYIGQIESYIPYINADVALEQVVEQAYDEVGEAVGDYLSDVSKQEIDFLSERLNETLSEWLRETKNNPEFWRIINVEKVKI
jgi:hypothetical protein